MKLQSFRKGIVDGIPICLGYLSVSFAFGIFAVESGFSILEALLLSMCCVTSAGQLAAVPIIAGLGNMIELSISQLVINMRYALMSVSLSQKLDNGISLADRFAVAFINTDEVFAVASGQKGLVNKWYMYGLILTPWLGWSSGTLMGAVAGNILPEIVTTSLGVAIYGMFIAIVIPESKKSRPTAICAGLAVVLSCLFCYLPGLKDVPSGFTIIVCAVIASTVMAIFSPIPTEVSEDV